MPELNNEQTVLNNTEQIRAWFRTCPALLATNRFRVDYLSENPTEYAIYASPSTINYHENVLGEAIPDDIQTVNFIFASKESFGADVQQTLANMGFYVLIITSQKKFLTCHPEGYRRISYLHIRKNYV